VGDGGRLRSTIHVRFELGRVEFIKFGVPKFITATL
jgi:hypothetical protein